MSDRLLKESDVIEAFKGREPLIHDVYTAVAIIRSVPSAGRSQGWIPCSERLPREEEQDDELGVLVTLGNGYSGLQYDWYHDGYWYDWNGFVVAWMPLPQPMKGADDE